MRHFFAIFLRTNIITIIMVVYTCERCLKTFDKKYAYDVHINRKNPCEKLVDRQTEQHISESGFYFLLNELKTIKNELIELKEENKNLKTKINKIEPSSVVTKTRKNINKPVNSYNSISDSHNTNSNNVHNVKIVNLVAFGKEKMDFPLDDIAKLCQGNRTIPNMINHVHFNKDLPENHNVYMPNRKNRKEVFVYDGENWMLSNKNNIVEQLVDKGITYVEGKIDELRVKLSKSKLNAVQRAIEIFNDENHEHNKEISKKITDEVELILYNKKNIAINTNILTANATN